MLGKRYLLDTNAVLALLKGNRDLIRDLNDAGWLGISITTKIEFLAFPAMDQHDQSLFQKFERRIEVVGLENVDTHLIKHIIYLRNQYRLKIPNAIIAATARHQAATLITSDHDFNKVAELNVLGFSLKSDEPASSNQ